MTSERWRLVRSVFERALEHAPEDRAAFVAREAGADAALQAEVEQLLAAAPDAEAYFDTLGLAVGGGAAEDERARIETVGPYRLGEALGFGGMGAVYRAVRDDGAFRREVAVKLIRRGVHSDEAARRFRVERQALAALRHPHIAGLLGGGVTADGQPWLAMELVEGEPVTTYCDGRRLGVEARLRLFLQVCGAVQHAHRRLVVHRDLKPSNILVTEGDAEGSVEGGAAVKLLDFGLAKLLDDDPGVTVPATGADRRLLTPAYAAPEQVAGEPVTTAADVYALGVVLYELLTGRRPPPGAAPPRPSAVVVRPHAARSTHGETRTVAAEDVAAARSTTALRLRRRLRVDLDQICLQALRAEPERRYASTEALCRDVQRHLDGLPVEARPAAFGYRVGKFVRRHRAGVAAAAAGVLVLAAGLALAVWQGRQAEAERDRAERTAAFMTDLLAEFDPNRAGAGGLDAGDVLDRAVRRVETGLRGQPEVQAQLYDHVGQIYQTYARYDDAERLLHRALAVRRALYGERHPEVAESLNHIAWLAFARGDYAAADSTYAAAVVVQEAGEGRRTPTAAAAIEGRGLLRRAAGDPEGGIAFVREALAIREATLPEGHPDISASVSALATLHHYAGRPAEAAPLFRRAIAERRRSLGDHAHTAQSLSDYGAVLTALGDIEGAAGAHREALAIRRDLLGPSHPHVAQSLSHLGWALQTQGRYAEAEPLYREALAIRREHLGDDHTAVGNSLLVLGEIRLRQGDASDGLATIDAAVRTMARVLGADHPTTISAELRRAEALGGVGRGAEARAEARRLLPALRAAFGAAHAKVRACDRLARGA